MFNPFEKVFDTNSKTIIELEPLNALYYTIHTPSNIKKIDSDGYFLTVEGQIIGFNINQN